MSTLKNLHNMVSNFSTYLLPFPVIVPKLQPYPTVFSFMTVQVFSRCLSAYVTLRWWALTSSQGLASHVVTENSPKNFPFPLLSSSDFELGALLYALSILTTHLWANKNSNSLLTCLLTLILRTGLFLAQKMYSVNI